MMTVVGCFVGSHDHRLIALAVAICALASFTAVQLLCHAQRSQRALRMIWLGVASAAGGSGIWATHFIAMLAYMPGVPSGYNLGLTVLSMVYAILLTGCGLGIALSSALPYAAWAGGAFVGGGIAVMHYTGMAAFQVAGQIIWDPWLVAASVFLGMSLGSLALAVAIGQRSLKRQILAAAILMLAISSHHFTGMGAVTIIPDPTIEVAASALSPSWLAIAVALASFNILLFAGAALALDLRDRQRAATESDRLHSLANAAVEGLLVCRGDRIVSANDSFARLMDSTPTALNEMTLSTFLFVETTRLFRADLPEQALETDLKRPDGTLIPIELIVRTVEYGRAPHYAIAIRDLRARRKAERQIQFLALHDGLTGLANRTSFNTRLEQDMQVALAKGGKLAVLCLDLDRFKDVNDVFGHAAGDKLLQDVARIVTGVLDESQMMSRLGGDEFAVIASVEHAAGAGRLAERILEALRDAGSMAIGPMIATSIGIAIYPDNADDRTLLLNYADTALYRAKSEGRGTYRFYEEKMGDEVRDRRLIELDLRHAIARKQMRLVFQPQTNVTTGDIIGFEALLRWDHPVRGNVPPGIFIPIAEESGLILQLGEWVLRESCREAATWNNPLLIAVNVSPVQIHSPHFVRMIQEALFQTALQPHRLEIEITETALIRDPARALSTMSQVKTLGIRIAMDDFGTGYSSLSNLRHFPFDKIKIDGSFIKSVHTNVQTAAIVRSVLGLGRGLGLPVLAEGVETFEELDFLKKEACTEVQGYFTGRPAPIGEFIRFTSATAVDTPDASIAA